MGDPIILTDALLAVGTGTASADRDISNRLRSISWNQEFEDHDVTTMGSTQRVHALGLSDGSLEGELLMSYSTADAGENIDRLLETLNDLSATGKSFLVRLRPKNAAKNATNPEYSMLAKSAKKTIIEGEVGNPQMTGFIFLPAGNITRATASS
jgi:hypothetical protein